MSRFAGIDVHKDTLEVVAVGKKGFKERSHFKILDDLKKLVKWLKSNRVKAVALESTGIYCSA